MSGGEAPAALAGVERQVPAAMRSFLCRSSPGGDPNVPIPAVPVRYVAHRNPRARAGSLLAPRRASLRHESVAPPLLRGIGGELS